MKTDLVQEVIMKGREYGISMVLFRHMVGDSLGVNVTDMECLALLFHKGISSPSELSKHTGLTSGATTAMLDRLEQADLIARRPNPQDRRGTLIAINSETAEKIRPLFDAIRNAQQKLIAQYSEKELEIIAAYFQKSVAIWNEERITLQQKIRNVA